MVSDKPFSLRIEADEALLKLLPGQWERYFSKTDDSQTELVIKIREEEALAGTSYSEGWSSHPLNGVRQAVYAPKGRAYFSLTYALPVKEVTVCVRKALEVFVRCGVLFGMLTASHQTCVGLHGVTLVCGEQAVLLSAPSGTGKTTLAGLLEKHCGAKVINGDFALLSLTEDGMMFEPTPFCGTSHICLNERRRVNRIVFLSQSDRNHWEDLDGRQAVLNTLNNAFVPSFDAQLQQAIQNNIVRMLPYVRLSSFAFAPTEEAARFFRSMIA